MEFASGLVFLFTVCLSMLPVIEIHGALPLAMSTTFWGSGALSPVGAFFACLIGGTIVCFIAVLIFLPFRKLLEKIKICKKIFEHRDKAVIEWIQKRNLKKQEKLNKKHKNKKAEVQKTATENNISTQITFSNTLNSTNKDKVPKKKIKDNTLLFKGSIVFIFCLLPIPFSGVWSASALCSILKLKFWPSVLVLILANLANCIFFGLLCTIFEDFIDLFLVVMFLIMIFIGVYYFFSYIITKKQKIKQ